MTMKGSKYAQKGSLPQNSFDSIYPGACQKVAFSGASAAVTNAFAANVSIVRLYADQDCYVKFGASPTATVNDMLLPAGVTEYFAVDAGAKIAALQVSTAGTLYITEGAAS